MRATKLYATGDIWAPTIGIGRFFLLMIFPVSSLGYGVTTPFLVFGSLALGMSLLVESLFERARKLDGSETIA